MTSEKLAGAEGRKTLPRPRGVLPTPINRAAGSSTSTAGLVAKLLLLGLVAALAVLAAPPLISGHQWMWLGVLVVTTLLIFYAYLSPRRIALKYFVPGVLFLIGLQILPVLLTATTAFTNFGDAHRGSKADAISAIQSDSVKQVPGSTDYSLSVATKGDPATGPLVFLLLDPAGVAYAGDTEGLHKLTTGSVTSTGGKITAADGYSLLTFSQSSLRPKDIENLVVPTADGAIRAIGFSRAYDGKAVSHYDSGCDCITNSDTGQVWHADNRNGLFVADNGDRLPQGWKVNVGLRNLGSVLTDSRISQHFLSTLAWNLTFAVLSVFVTFALGVAIALALNSDRIRGLRFYRILLVLPYAMPSFAMLLVWSDMFNQDFGLINKLLGLDVDWFGNPWTARFAVILIQLWLGYPYMFLVSTGALQAIPRELGEAASIDGATPWARFRQVTLPLLLVALSPLLISSFAYNFNNFNAIRLTTDGGPFPATDSTTGATDLLVTYTYRLAFGGSGAQFGLAAAVSIYIFAIVTVIAAVSFRRTRAQEEVFS
jgi:arabinogalactan oligomer / maltooligosaccharide transport system permease protein